MRDETPAPVRRPRHWLIDAALGTTAATALVGLALAAAPQPPAAPAPQPRPQRALLTRAVAPQARPVLISFRDPLPGGEVGSPFGLRQLPWEEGGRLHAGIDIISRSHAPVLAAADGVVTDIGRDPGYGRFVALRHAEGLTTLYAHLASISVEPGQALKAGAVVGEVGSTGSSTGPHLHFEIRDAKDRPMNPELFLNRQFAQACDLPLAKAHRVGRRVRIAHVSHIPASHRAQMQEKLARRAAGDASAVSAADFAVQASATEKIDGLRGLHRGADGRPRAQLSF